MLQVLLLSKHISSQESIVFDVTKKYSKVININNGTYGHYCIYRGIGIRANRRCRTSTTNDKFTVAKTDTLTQYLCNVTPQPE